LEIEVGIEPTILTISPTKNEGGIFLFQSCRISCLFLCRPHRSVPSITIIRPANCPWEGGVDGCLGAVPFDAGRKAEKKEGREEGKVEIGKKGQGELWELWGIGFGIEEN
jgi:hypothetical protein